jgi:glycosyltransferase involved in cell wall biosynthesis
MEHISSIIITRNEERNIADCVRSVKPFSDEVLIIDSSSTDRTVPVSRSLGCRVLTRKFDTFIRQKNFGLSRARFDRVFFIDADERVPPALAATIAEMKKRGFDRDAYRIPRRNLYLGRHAWYGGWGSDWMYFLFDRRKCRYEGAGVHERLSTRGSSIGKLGPFVQHSPYADLGQHLRKIDAYSRLFAFARAGWKRPFLALEILFRPVFKFLKCYIIQAAFLAGWRGLFFSVMASFSVFMKYARLLEMKMPRTAGRKGK